MADSQGPTLLGSPSPGIVSVDMKASAPSGYAPFDTSQPGPYKWWEWTVHDFILGDPWLQEENRCRACGLCLPGPGFYKCPCWHWTCFVPKLNCCSCKCPSCKCCSLPKPTGCRCVFPSTYLGIGWHCPYCCCGKCPCKLEEQEQLYWFRLSDAEKHKKPEEPKIGMCTKLCAKCPILGGAGGGCPSGCPTNPMKKFGGGGGLSDEEREALFSLREIFKDKIADLPKPIQATMKKPKPGTE